MYLACSYEKTIPHYSGTLKATYSKFWLRGYHALWLSIPEIFTFFGVGRMRPIHHISTGFLRGFGLIFSAFARCYSRNHVCFLFLLILKCFTSQGSLSLMGILRIIEPQADVLLKNLGVYVYMRLTRAYRSLSRSSSDSKPRYPPNSEGVLASTWGKIQITRNMVIAYWILIK